MAMHFDRWEKDPFFSAAEEVQESTDRMESTYRTWMHALKDASHAGNSEELGRDLRTALGTAKWQLEEFERAVKCSYKNNTVDEANDRHRQFILATEEKVSVVENMLWKRSATDGKAPTRWVRLDEGERDEFAMFLSGSTVYGENLDIGVVGDCDRQANSHGRIAKPLASPLKNKSYASGLHLIEGKNAKFPGHRRSASASADIGSLDISVYENKFEYDSSIGWAEPPPRRVPSYSGLSAAMESAPKLMLPKNGFRKWKAAERQQDDYIGLLRPTELSQEMNASCEKSKSCLNTSEDCCNKELYGWYGAVQRMLRRSQYQVQYSRSVQLIFWISLLLFFIVLVFRVI